MKELIKNLEELNRKTEKGGGDARIEKQHSVGKLTARERIDLLPVSYTHLTLPTTSRV